MRPSSPVLHRCPNSDTPRAVDRHETNSALPRHGVFQLGPEGMPECVECGARHVFTLFGALAFARDWSTLEKMPPAVKASLLESIARLEWYALQRWGRGLDLQTSEDLPRELFRLRDHLRLTIPGLGTFDDIDAAWASDSNGAKNNDLHPDECSAGGRSGRRRMRLNPSSTSKRYLPYGLMCSYRAGESRAMSSSFTVLPSARSRSITAAM